MNGRSVVSLVRVLYLALILLLAFRGTATLADDLSLAGFAGGIEISGSSTNPLIAEIDGDSSNGKEIAVASRNGTVTVLKRDGTTLWSAYTPNYGCARTSDSDKVYSSPAAGDLNQDGANDLVLGYGGYASGREDTAACHGGVVAFDGRSGQILWNLDLGKFAKKQHFFSFFPSVYSTPAIADVNGDGKLEIAFGSLDRNVYLLNYLGKVLFYYLAADTIFSSPAFANVNNDTLLDLIIGTDISGNNALKPPTKDGGNVYALSFDKANFKRRKTKPYRCYFRDDDCVVWMTPVNQVVQSAPVIADFVSSVAGEEVAIGTGCYFGKELGKKILVLNLSSGSVLRTLQTTACMTSSVAAGDVDGDGLSEVIALVSGHASFGGDGTSKLVVYDAESGSVQWQASLENSSYSHNDAAIASDLDGNGSLEIMVSDKKQIKVYEGSTGELLSCDNSDCSAEAELEVSGSSTVPAAGDLDGDGDLELVGSSGAVFAWGGFAGVLNSQSGPHPPNSSPSAMWRIDSSRKGNVD